MTFVRALPLILSLLVHGAGAWALVGYSNALGALDAGNKNDQTVLARTLVIENVQLIGNASLEAAKSTPVISGDDGGKITPEQSAKVVTEDVKRVAPKPVRGLKRAVRKKTAKKLSSKKVSGRKRNGKKHTGKSVRTASLQRRRSAGRVSAGGRASLRSAYLGRIRRRIQGAKIRPNDGKTGRAMVRIVVNSRGRLVSSRISRSSGSSALDRAAIRSVRRASPFGAFPKGLRERTLAVSVPFRYQ